MKHRIYVASSWRNAHQPNVCEYLRVLGHDVYDFRDPIQGSGFGWDAASPYSPETWSVRQFREVLQTPVASRGLSRDAAGLRWCTALVLVMPCGASSHLELGWAIAANKHTAVYYPEKVPVQAELMVGLADAILDGATNDLERWIGQV